MRRKILIAVAAALLGGCTATTGSITPPPGDAVPPAGDVPPGNQPPADQPPADQPPAEQPPADQPPGLGAETASSSFLGHALQISPAGNAIAVADRTQTVVPFDVTVNHDGGVATHGSISSTATMTGGTPIAGAAHMPVVAGKEALPTPSFQSGDAFLEHTPLTANMALASYLKQTGQNSFVAAYGIAGTRTQTMPAVPGVGTATYQGQAGMKLLGSASGLRDAEGDAALAATFFSPELALPGTIGGTVTNIKSGSQNQGFELRLDAQISGNGYSGGSVGLQAVGGGATPGVTVTSSDMQGGFYGAGAVDTGGTFTFEASGVPVVGGGTETLGAAGFFHGSCQPACP